MTTSRECSVWPGKETGSAGIRRIPTLPGGQPVPLRSTELRAARNQFQHPAQLHRQHIGHEQRRTVHQAVHFLAPQCPLSQNRDRSLLAHPPLQRHLSLLPRRHVARHIDVGPGPTIVPSYDRTGRRRQKLAAVFTHMHPLHLRTTFRPLRQFHEIIPEKQIGPPPQHLPLPVAKGVGKGLVDKHNPMLLIGNEHAVPCLHDGTGKELHPLFARLARGRRKRRQRAAKRLLLAYAIGHVRGADPLLVFFHTCVS